MREPSLAIAELCLCLSSCRICIQPQALKIVGSGLEVELEFVTDLLLDLITRAA